MQRVKRSSSMTNLMSLAAGFRNVSVEEAQKEEIPNLIKDGSEGASSMDVGTSETKSTTRCRNRSSLKDSSRSSLLGTRRVDKDVSSTTMVFGLSSSCNSAMQERRGLGSKSYIALATDRLPETSNSTNRSETDEERRARRKERRRKSRKGSMNGSDVDQNSKGGEEQQQVRRRRSCSSSRLMKEGSDDANTTRKLLETEDFLEKLLSTNAGQQQLKKLIGNAEAERRQRRVSANLLGLT